MLLKCNIVHFSYYLAIVCYILYFTVLQVLWFYIVIVDINDNAPVFVNAPYVVNISEVQYFYSEVAF